MIIQQKMTKEVTFSNISLMLKESYKLSLLKYIFQSEEPLTIKAQIVADNCYDCIIQQITLKDGNQGAQEIVQFIGQLSILCDGIVNDLDLSVSFFFRQSRISTSNTKINIAQNDKGCLQLSITDASSEPIGKMKLVWKAMHKEPLPFITLKNINCELKNNINSPNVSRFLQIIIGKKKYKSRTANGVLYWDSPVKIFFQQERSMAWTLIQEDLQQKITIPSQRTDDFTLQEGFRRVFITDEYEMPKGCIQFYYQSHGLRPQEEYERLAELQANNQRQILKLTVKTIKGKLKLPHNNVSVRVFSGINFLKTEQTIQQSNQLFYTLNKYLYLESRENRSNFIVYSNDEVIGFGALQLNIIGFFQRRVGIISPATKKQIGYLMVSIQSEKHLANIIQLAKLRLSLGQLQLDKSSYFLSFFIKGIYTRTEIQRFDGSSEFSFRRLILMKYTKEEEIEIALTSSSNKEILRTVVSIQMLKQCSNPAVCQKIIKLSPQFECRLKITCIYGDLNKINIFKIGSSDKKTLQSSDITTNSNEKQSINTHQKQVKAKPHPSTLLQQKINKQIQAERQKSRLQEQFKQFEKTLVNHVNPCKIAEKWKFNLDVNKLSFLSNSGKEKRYRIMFISRSKQRQSVYPQVRSEEKRQLKAVNSVHIQLPQLKLSRNEGKLSSPFQIYSGRKNNQAGLSGFKRLDNEMHRK